MARAPDLAYAIGLQPTEAIKYFESLGYRISRNAVHAYNAAQARAFTVTGMTRMDMLQDVKSGLDKALRNGTTFGTFQNETNDLLRRRGWVRTSSGSHADPGTGEVVANLPPRRMQTIFRTNMQSALMAGKYQQLMEDVDIAPYWQYVAIMDGKTRPSHAAMHGRIFRYDDPIWGSHFPPCDFNCRCGVRNLRLRDIERRGLFISDSAGMLEPTEILVGRQTRPAIAFVDKVTKTRFVAGPGFGQRPIQVQKTLGQVLGQKVEQVAPEISAKIMNTTPQLAAPLADEYRSWAKAVLEASKSRETVRQVKDTYRVATTLTPKIVTALWKNEIIPKNAAITVRGSVLQRIATTLGETDALALPSLMTAAVAMLWDKQEQLLVYVLRPVPDTTRYRRVRVRLSGAQATKRSEVYGVDSITLSGLRSARYELIEGSLDD